MYREQSTDSYAKHAMGTQQCRKRCTAEKVCKLVSLQMIASFNFVVFIIYYDAYTLSDPFSQFLEFMS